MTTDTSEKGLEALIVADMTGHVAAPIGACLRATGTLRRPA